MIVRRLLFFLNLIFLCYVAQAVFNAPTTFAQSLSLSLSPPILEVFIKPGKSVTQVYKLTNNGEPVIITPYIAMLSSSGIKEDPNFTPENWFSLLNTDIKLNEPFLLPSKQTKQIILRINPPLNTKMQDYYRALVFSTTPSPADNSTISQISENLAAPLIVTVTESGLVPKGAVISKFEVPSFIDSFDPLDIDVEVQNTGRIYFHPNGKIELKGLLGKASYKLIPNVVLAGERKKLITENTVGTTSDNYTLHLSGFFIGRYEVELNFTLDEGKEQITARKTFYALPFKASLVISTLLVLTFLLGKRKKKDAA
jgi:hypothetical protein